MNPPKLSRPPRDPQPACLSPPPSINAAEAAPPFEPPSLRPRTPQRRPSPTFSSHPLLHQSTLQPFTLEPPHSLTNAQAPHRHLSYTRCSPFPHLRLLPPHAHLTRSHSSSNYLRRALIVLNAATLDELSHRR
ncbi:uncharacterized protein A4U43_C08F23620 [Asparagus officinalis]|nr:uncharacterized protein A4U43_C08F23620 [Asparagus officinalis]